MSENSVYTSKESFLAIATAIPTRFVSLEKLGLQGGLWVRGLTTAQRRAVVTNGGGSITINKNGDQIIDLSSSKEADQLMMAFGIVTDESGDNRMFKNSKDPELSKVRADVTDLITKNIRELSGMGDDDPKESKSD